MTNCIINLHETQRNKLYPLLPSNDKTSSIYYILIKVLYHFDTFGVKLYFITCYLTAITDATQYVLPQPL